MGKELAEVYWLPGSGAPFLDLVKQLTGAELKADAWVDVLQEPLEKMVGVGCHKGVGNLVEQLTGAELKADAWVDVLLEPLGKMVGVVCHKGAVGHHGCE